MGFIFRKLSEEEKGLYRAWARENYLPGDHIDLWWHPITKKECRKINSEQKTVELKKILDRLYKPPHGRQIYQRLRIKLAYWGDRWDKYLMKSDSRSVD